MALSLRKPVWIIPLLFLGLVVWAAWREDPDFWRSASGLYQAAQEAESHKDYGRALELARKAWYRDQTNSDGGIFLGWLYLKAGQPQPALAVFRQVWGRDPQALGALTGQAQALELLGKSPEALGLLDGYLETHPQEAQVLRTAGALAARQRSTRARAVVYWQRLYQLNREPAVRRELVDLLLTQGRFAEAIPFQEEEAAEFPDSPEALHRLALLHYWQRDYQAATLVYQRLLELAAEDTALRQEAAQAAEAAQDLDQALAHYLRLYGMHQGKKEYALALARLWSRKGNHAEAAAVLAPLMQDQPDLELRRWYALELLLRGDFGLARKAYEAAWEAGDTHKETLINLARLHAQARHFDRAARFWDEARRRQLLKGDLAWEAALTYSYARRYREAREVLQPVDRQDPRNPRVLLFLGQLHFYQKQWGRAAHYLKAYLKGQPQDLEVRAQLAEILSFQDTAESLEEAQQQYAEILQGRDDAALRLKRVALLLKQAQQSLASREKERRQQAAPKWAEAAAELKRCKADPAAPKLLRQQARLYLWLGDFAAALSHYEHYLRLVPGDRQACLEKARVLVYMQRGPEALEVLRRLPPAPRTGPAAASRGKGNKGSANPGPPSKKPNTAAPKAPDSREDREILLLSLQAAVANKDWPLARDFALKLFVRQFPEKGRPPRDWGEALRWSRDLQSRGRFSLEERTWVARSLCHLPAREPLAGKGYRLATELLVQNLWKNRHHHPTLLLLAYLLPRLPDYEDLSRLVYRIPGIRAGSPEYVAALAFFGGNLGRHGGKLDYLLHVLKQYRRRPRPESVGELLGLADLAMELGERQAAARYLRQALELKPGDQKLTALLVQCQLARKDWAAALASLKKQGPGPENALQMARLYLIRGQFEGVKAMVAQVPESHPEYPQALLLLAQAQRGERNHPEALKTLAKLEGRLPREDWLMEKARVLEDQGDKGAVALYAEILKARPDSQGARVARARQARARGDWAGARRAFAQALEHAPQDIELLNELESVRQQQRPQVASRGFRYGRGERRPGEALRPWQFSRLDREVAGTGLLDRLNPLRVFLFAPARGQKLPEIREIPLIQPESLGFTDSNKIYGGVFRLAAGFWITKVLPAQVAVEYREYNQTQRVRWYQNNGRVENGTDTSSRLRRGEVSLVLGPVNPTDRLRLVGEIIGRRYWKRVDHSSFSQNRIDPAFPQYSKEEFCSKEDRSRILGSLSLSYEVSPRTEATLKYSRRDLFDQDPQIFPRLYQSVQNLEQARLTTLHQVELGYGHQFRPGLDWRGIVGGAFFSDRNRRLTLYQGLIWQALRQPRMRVEFTPHVYFAAYKDKKEAYFSPHSYTALGLSLDFHRQVFRLPTLILQGTVQGVGQHGDWGPALQGLAALEWELVHNFFIDPHVFYFREWVDNYRLLTVGLSLRYLF